MVPECVCSGVPVRSYRAPDPAEIFSIHVWGWDLSPGAGKNTPGQGTIS